MQINDPLLVISASAISLASTGDKLTFTPAFPVDLVRWGVIVTVTFNVGAGLTIKADKRPTAGSDTARTDGTGSKNLTTTTNFAAGKVVYVEPTAPVQVNPGEEIVFEVTDAADTAGTGYIFAHFIQRPWQGDSTVTSGNPGNRIGNATKI